MVQKPGTRGRRLSFKRSGLSKLAVGALLILSLGVWTWSSPVLAAVESPTVLDPDLDVRPAVTGLFTPTSMAFLGPNDFLVLEKIPGQVRRVTNGVLQSAAVLDLPVNSGSERGLLGIALHPGFPTNPSVYLYWTESSTGMDTSVLSNTPLLGNRVDRFVWNGSTLTFDQNLIRLRALQPPFPAEPTPTAGRGNNDGGVIRFGPDGKLYIFIGDVGRRGQTQNLPSGPTATGLGPTVPDDQFGGPEPDNAHLTGVILRLNDDGTAPNDNPFFDAGAAMSGEAGANIQKIFSYGHRNGFGMAFDPISGNLWNADNGDDAFDEINRIEPGQNGGWIQIMGPVSRISEFKAIESSSTSGLQQMRWPPTNIADTPSEALSRLFMLPGSQYSDPEFSWKFGVPPGAIGFMNGQGLGPEYAGDLFVGAATTNLEGGHLFHFNLTASRTALEFDDPRLADQVADNNSKHDSTESESLLFGKNFGIVTDIQTGPNGNLFVVSLINGAIYEIFRRSEIINDSLSLVNLSTSYNPIPISGFAGGTYRVTVTWQNTSNPTSFSDVFAEVAILQGNGCPCAVLNADGGPGGVGARVSLTDVLAPGETVTKSFDIGLNQRAPFSFFVNVLGVPQ